MDLQRILFLAILALGYSSCPESCECSNTGKLVKCQELTEMPDFPSTEEIWKPYFETFLTHLGIGVHFFK